MTEGLVVLINFFTVAIALHLLAVKYVKTTGGEFKLIVRAFTWRPAGWFCTFNGQHDIRVVFAKHQTKEGEFELRGITTWAKRMAFLLQGKATSSWFVLTIGFGNSGTCVLHPKTMQTNYPFADRIVLSLDLTDGNSLSVLAMPGDWKYVRVHMVKVGSPLAEHINQAEGQAEGYAWSRVVPTHIWDTDYGNWRTTHASCLFGMGWDALKLRQWSSRNDLGCFAPVSARRNDARSLWEGMYTMEDMLSFVLYYGMIVLGEELLDLNEHLNEAWNLLRRACLFYMRGATVYTDDAAFSSARTQATSDMWRFACILEEQCPLNMLTLNLRLCVVHLPRQELQPGAHAPIFNLSATTVSFKRWSQI
ncbi:hypothetical protein CYMTET_55279 [Cymbomonas tetramitiformis]|uniref:Uncharacterized protein n=1 Tax=Cymbomonas tetramitiformis TaxID=36881 RepID=A0AAE0ENR8_9CHLO|nr:hypothetical protein CYMTET_55279 [Cymbomonas tetramitiformis]